MLEDGGERGDEERDGDAGESDGGESAGERSRRRRPARAIDSNRRLARGLSTQPRWFSVAATCPVPSSAVGLASAARGCGCARASFGNRAYSLVSTHERASKIFEERGLHDWRDDRPEQYSRHFRIQSCCRQKIFIFRSHHVMSF